MSNINEAIKNSLNLGKTQFEMKANLNKKEPSIQQKWLDEKAYENILKKNANNKQWILHDGPPYANGDLHLGHSLNKILKDIIIRYKNMKGYYSPFIFGWDTHGLPIEHLLAKKIGNKYNQLSIAEKRKYCSEFALSNVQNQKNQFKRLGLFTNYEEIYMTMSKDFEIRQLDLFFKMYEKKLIYQALKPVYWSWSSQTALAEAEIEYKNIECYSIYITFDIIDGKNLLNKDDKLVVWTTTPWTIPSNLAIAINPNFTYLKVTINNQSYVVAENLLGKIAKILNWENWKIIKKFKGKLLENITYKHPLYEKINPIILANYVSIDDGTGLVHNAPDHGTDDYFACKAYNINPFCPIDHMGKFTSNIKDDNLIGVFYEDSNENIIQRLEKNNHLLKKDKIIHSAAVDWRTKKPVLYRATKQWFVDIDSVKDKILQCLDKVVFNSKSNRDHMKEMIRNRSEWCISRQRVWGVPICIIYDENNEPILDNDLDNNIINILKKEGTTIWFEKPIEYFLTQKYKSAKNYSKCTDTMDVWFDSGSSHLMFKQLGWNNQCDLYLEGNDQYRGWFNSSIITSVFINHESPYKQLISHGMAVDGQGKKMSKSLGNGIDPLKICDKYGADILRMWIANSDYEKDISISFQILDQISEIYRRIRNSLFRFCLANISDFDYEKDANFEFGEEDLYVLNQLNENIIAINNAYEKFNFATIIKIINSHIIELSSWYFDLIKDCLYCDYPNDKKRRTIQTVLYNLLNIYLCFLYPIIPHTTSEAYHFFNKSNKQKDIMFEQWIDKLPFNIRQINKKQWSTIFILKNKVFTEIERMRNNKILNKTNEADVMISFNNETNISENLLKKIFNVANIKIINQTKSNVIDIQIKKTKYIKCIRCWNYFPTNQMHDELCQRCSNILKK